MSTEKTVFVEPALKLDIASIHVSTEIIYSQTKCTSVFVNRIVSVAILWSIPLRVVWFFIISSGEELNIRNAMFG